MLLCIDGYFSVDKKLQIGFITQQKVSSLLDNGDASSYQVSKFFKSVRAFFEKAVEYALKWLPLSDELLQAATCVNVLEREIVNPLDFEFFVHR